MRVKERETASAAKRRNRKKKPKKQKKKIQMPYAIQNVICGAKLNDLNSTLEFQLYLSVCDIYTPHTTPHHTTTVARRYIFFYYWKIGLLNNVKPKFERSFGFWGRDSLNGILKINSSSKLLFCLEAKKKINSILFGVFKRIRRNLALRYRTRN